MFSIQRIDFLPNIIIAETMVNEKQRMYGFFARSIGNWSFYGQS